MLLATQTEGLSRLFDLDFQLLADSVLMIIAMFFHNIKDNPWVEKFFRGVRPAVVALIAAPCFKMAKTAGITWRTVWIPIVCCLLIALANVSPIYLIIIAGVAGWLLGRCTKWN